jgi:hypothetical protein
VTVLSETEAKSERVEQADHQPKLGSGLAGFKLADPLPLYVRASG